MNWWAKARIARVAPQVDKNGQGTGTTSTDS